MKSALALTLPTSRSSMRLKKTVIVRAAMLCALLVSSAGCVTPSSPSAVVKAPRPTVPAADPLLMQPPSSPTHSASAAADMSRWQQSLTSSQSK